jgi:hypothetical protein
MITTNLLVTEDGQKERSNQNIKELCELIQEYNSLPTTPDFLSARAHVLSGMLVRVAFWVTNRRPKQTPKNLAKWQALCEIGEQIAREADTMGVRLLSGPKDWKTVADGLASTRSYWLEACDAKHRSGQYLSEKFAAWLAASPSDLDQSFWAYLGDQGVWSSEVLYHPDPVRFYAGFDDSGLLYDDWITAYGPAHTRTLQTVFSGRGWAIFVVDTDDLIFMYEQVQGRFHHSSFLSGAPVRCAGEIVVNHGHVKVVTAKSGHYMPTTLQMQHLVRTFPQLPDDAIIRPDMLDEVGGNKPKFFRIKDFRDNFVNAAVLNRQNVLDAVPAWAQNAKSLEYINKIDT